MPGSKPKLPRASALDHQSCALGLCMKAVASVGLIVRKLLKDQVVLQGSPSTVYPIFASCRPSTVHLGQAQRRIVRAKSQSLVATTPKVYD